MYHAALVALSVVRLTVSGGNEGEIRSWHGSHFQKVTGFSIWCVQSSNIRHSVPCIIAIIIDT